jgi:hypothetical protein
MNRRFQPITAIVARACSHPDPLGVGRDRHGQLGGGQTRLLHQGRRAVRLKLRFQRPNAVRRIEGPV